MICNTKAMWRIEFKVQGKKPKVALPAELCVCDDHLGDAIIAFSGNPGILFVVSEIEGETAELCRGTSNSGHLYRMDPGRQRMLDAESKKIEIQAINEVMCSDAQLPNFPSTMPGMDEMRAEAIKLKTYAAQKLTGLLRKL